MYVTYIAAPALAFDALIEKELMELADWTYRASLSGKRLFEQKLIINHMKG